MAHCILLDKSKEEALLQCELRIKDALQSVLEATYVIGLELKYIHAEELFRATHSTWYAYIKERWEMSPGMAYKLMRLGARLPDILNKSRELGIPSPENEAQMRPLLRLSPPEALEVWVKAATKAKEDNVALSQPYIESFTDESLKARKPSDRRSEKGMDITESTRPISKTSGLQEYEFDADEDPRLLAHSAKARSTFERVLALFGQEAYDSILAGVLKISEKDLVKWGAYQDQDFQAVGKYLIENRWSFHKAEQFVFQTITENTKAETLINLALARGGSLRVKVNGFTIEVYRDTLGISSIGKN